MYARVATFEGGNEDEMMRLSEERSSSGQMEPPDGMRRAMVLSDHSGRRLFITFFDSREAIDAAEQRFEQMGDEIPEDIRGRRTGIDVYEVVWEREA